MMDIEKIALDFLSNEQEQQNQDITNPTRKTIKRTRRALQNSYDFTKQKYAYEKGIVDSIVEEAKALERQYTNHKEKMQKYYDRMIELRNLLNKIDDQAASFIELDRNNISIEDIGDEDEV